MLTQKYLKEVLKYNPTSGCFKWKCSTNRRVKTGDVAGTINSRGYRVITISKTLHKAHRLAWLYIYGSWPENNIDHIDGDKTNNKINNLRDVTHIENCRNVKKRSDNTSGVTGVYWSKTFNKWVVMIGVESKQKFIGYFKCKNEAIAARIKTQRTHNFHDNHGVTRQ